MQGAFRILFLKNDVTNYLEKDKKDKNLMKLFKTLHISDFLRYF